MSPRAGPVPTTFDLFDPGGLEVQGDWSASGEPALRKGASFPDLPFVEYDEDRVTWSVALEVPAGEPPGRKPIRVQAGHVIRNEKTCSAPGRWTPARRRTGSHRRRLIIFGDGGIALAW